MQYHRKPRTNADIRAKWELKGWKFVPYSQAPIEWVVDADDFYWGGADPATGLSFKFLREDA